MILTSETDWDALLEASPDDDLLKSAFADWLEEQGRDREALGWRRLVKGGHHPCDCTKYSIRNGKDQPFLHHGNRWVWFHDGKNHDRRSSCNWWEWAIDYTPHPELARIPPWAFDRLSPDGTGVGYYTCLEAIRALAEVLSEG